MYIVTVVSVGIHRKHINPAAYSNIRLRQGRRYNRLYSSQIRFRMLNNKTLLGNQFACNILSLTLRMQPTYATLIVILVL